MEGSVKDFARAKHRLTKHRNRVHGGRGTGAGATAPAGSKPPRHAAGAAPGGLETNAERYESSEDEAEGVLQRRSQGQDLAKLLAAAQNDVTTRPARHWSMLRALSDDQVPRNIADAFKDVALDLGALERCLRAVPVATLLGLDPQVVGASAHPVRSIFDAEEANTSVAGPGTRAPGSNGGAQAVSTGSVAPAGQATRHSSLRQNQQPQGDAAPASVGSPQPPQAVGGSAHLGNTPARSGASAPGRDTRAPGQAASAADLDAELDSLLNASLPAARGQGAGALASRDGGSHAGAHRPVGHIVTGAAAVRSPQAAAPTRKPAAPPAKPPPKSRQELEDWLDL